ncbi:putative exosome component 2 [Cardiosporidium cionae]|uniref:Exosome component 2 n=1 Tax=Cardiosporidium cionae TaxID=476202 RepID=A0ABQ7JE32_9APIC|nr:putative exosome component 2 [Cardiosporidium cionae]|eukprot:KAF8822278.1 putative exosome component 2 [Cardiosporidium cionae]
MRPSLPSSSFSQPVGIATVSTKSSFHLVIPGDILDVEPGYIKGHGICEIDGKLIANYCGIVKKVNKLIYVSPLNSRYVGHAGDVVVGRIDEISNGKWLVDVGSSQRAQLSLQSINLPGSVQRKRLDEDYLEMRKFFMEGDIVCCEVQRTQARLETLIFL